MTLTKEENKKLDAYFRAANYLSVAQLYLMDNILLKKPLSIEHIKPYVVGHWGTAPGQNFIYVHLNRVIKKNNLNMLYVSGPGHGGQALTANTYLEGSYTEIYPYITEDYEGLKRLCKQFSFPGGVSSHVAPETPGSINEGGELGYSLSHAFGAVLDNPDLIVACVVGDGEAETGPLATSWHANKFINPTNDGVVLPILHMNGYKIANPTIFARIPKTELESYFKGCGYRPYFVKGNDPEEMHELMAATMDSIIEEIKEIKENWNEGDKKPLWPMIILDTPKGWTGPKEIDGHPNEDSFRSHQVPIVISKEKPEKLGMLEAWLKSYRPNELFDDNGKLKKDLKELAPEGSLRMGSNKHANGGLLLKDLKCPDFRDYKVDVPVPGSVLEQDMKILGKYVRDVVKLNQENFRIFGPDEALSNRLNSVFEITNRQWLGEKLEKDEFLSTNGRVMDAYLSEHLCEGMLEGYLLTGRHGFFHSYEAFIRIVDSMASQHAKWLKVTSELSWRKDIASLNYILSSHVWQQDHNGYTHQNPGFLNHLVTKKASITRMYLPPDANCLLSCFDHSIRSKNYINVIVASKHPRPQWLTMEEAVEHCTKGIGKWEFACNDEGNPDIILASAGDTPTLEILAATTILRKSIKNIKIRVVNVIDLYRLQSNEDHPHGMKDEEYNKLFTKNKPIIFGFHGYPDLIHQLTYKRENQDLHVHGYIEEGTITTPFDMRVQNKLDRFNLVISACKYLKQYDTEKLVTWCEEKLKEHTAFISENGQDMPDVQNWVWEEAIKEALN